MKITTPEGYQRALDRIDELRAAGETVESSQELADLESAITGYELKPDEPDESKAKPTSDPYEKE